MRCLNVLYQKKGPHIPRKDVCPHEEILVDTNLIPLNSCFRSSLKAKVLQLALIRIQVVAIAIDIVAPTTTTLHQVHHIIATEIITKIEITIEVIETVKEVIEAVIKNVIMLAFSAKSETKKLAPPAAQAQEIQRVQRVQITRNMLVSAWPIHVQVWRGVSNTSTAI